MIDKSVFFRNGIQNNTDDFTKPMQFAPSTHILCNNFNCTIENSQNNPHASYFSYNGCDLTTEDSKKPACPAPRKSLVQVCFFDNDMCLTYYNDKFDLHCGDIVWVDGKLLGHRGYITEVNYNFTIKLSKYQRVIGKIDTNIDGQLYIAGNHFLTFNKNAMPISKVSTWFKTPEDEEEYVCSSDGTSFPLNDLVKMNVTSVIAERGYNYYKATRVSYLCLDGNHGYAIVQGTEPYDVNFEYNNGQISNLFCSCYCCYDCKHEVATMLQLQELLAFIKNHYKAEYEASSYFAAISQSTLFNFTKQK